MFEIAASSLRACWCSGPMGTFHTVELLAFGFRTAGELRAFEAVQGLKGLDAQHELVHLAFE